MRWDVLWPTIYLILCHDGLQKVKETEHLEATLMKDKIAYRGSIENVGPSTNISGSSTSWGDIYPPHPTRMLLTCSRVI